MGNYEKRLKPQRKQTLGVDLICFTNNPQLVNRGNWTLDYTPYHELYPSPLDNGSFINSLKNNKHPFNTAKFYKQQFYLIPCLRQYDIVIWMDATIEILDSGFAAHVNSIVRSGHYVGTSDHPVRMGLLANEVQASVGCGKYATRRWAGHTQPFQDVRAQYKDYLRMGFVERKHRNVTLSYRRNQTPIGVWWTAVVFFDMKSPESLRFLDSWYLQGLKYTTQDQVTFPFVCQMLGIIPYTFPDRKYPEIPKLLKYWPHGV
jgi:hypothetical protein